MTVVIMALLGGVVGGVLLSDFSGFVFGLVVGALAGWVVRPRGSSAHARAAARGAKSGRSAERRARSARVSPQPSPRRHRRCASRSARRCRRRPSASLSSSANRWPQLASRRPRRRRDPRRPARRRWRARGAARALDNLEPSVVEALFRNALRWFTTGNVPVKVGVVLSLFGVGFLVKEGIDRQWVVLPIEYRLMLVALFGIGLLALGWRLRARNRIYALSVQGGGIGVLYLTIFASFSLYDLLPAAVAFPLLVVVTAAAGALAVLQDAHALAVLGVLGGFLAPVLVSTGSGQSRRAVQLLRGARPRDSRHRVVQGLARAERARLLVHVRHRHAVGHRRLHAREIRDDRAVPRAVHVDVSRDPRAVRDARRAEAARLRRRHADVRHADRRVQLAEPARRGHGVRARDQRRRARVVLRRHGRHTCTARSARACACSSKRNSRSPWRS